MRLLKHRAVVLFIMVCLVLVTAVIGGSAATYPSKPITFIAFMNPGSGGDIFTRQLAVAMEKQLDQKIIVVNKIGGSGVTAYRYLFDQPADGYNVALATRTLTIIVNLPGTPFTAKDFDYIGRTVGDTFALAVNVNSPYTSLQKFIELAKAKPGLKVGGSVLQSAHYLSMKTFADAVGIKLTYVPFEGQADAVASMLGGHLDAVWTNPSLVAPQFKVKQVRILGISGSERLGLYPDVPSIKELGFDYEEYHWRGLVIKPGTPDAIKQRLHDAMVGALKDPDFKKYMESAELSAAYLSGKDFKDYVIKEADESKKLLIEAGAIR